MVLCRRPLILTTDLVWAGSIAGLVVFVVLVIVIPAQRDMQALPGLLSRLTTVQERFKHLSASNPIAVRLIQEHEDKLRERADQPLADIGNLLACLSEECRRNGIRLLEIQPLMRNTSGTHQSWDVHLRAEGAFPDFQKLLHRLEAISPYIQIENLSVHGPSATGTNACNLSWTVRMNSLRTDPAPRSESP